MNDAQMHHCLCWLWLGVRLGATTTHSQWPAHQWQGISALAMGADHRDSSSNLSMGTAHPLSFSGACSQPHSQWQEWPPVLSSHPPSSILRGGRSSSSVQHVEIAHLALGTRVVVLILLVTGCGWGVVVANVFSVLSDNIPASEWGLSPQHDHSCVKDHAGVVVELMVMFLLMEEEGSDDTVAVDCWLVPNLELVYVY